VPDVAGLSFAKIDSSGEVWEYAALVISLSDEILTLGQLYRNRADCENTYELKNHWGWGGFTTACRHSCVSSNTINFLELFHLFHREHCKPRGSIVELGLVLGAFSISGLIYRALPRNAQQVFSSMKRCFGY